MRRLTCDVAIVGAGTAGLAAWSAARHAGARTILIEGGPAGTTCARVGCMPSKLLIAAAESAQAARRARRFGIEAGQLAIDPRAVMARLQAERGHFVAGVLRSLHDIPAEGRLYGRARFLDRHRLAVEGHTEVEARAIVLATGARPNLPPPFRGLGERLLTNETLFELPALPDSVAVVGAGPLGLELGQALHRLGVRTSLFDQGPHLGGLQDREVAACARTLFSAELELHLGVEVKAEAAAGGVRVCWQGSGERGEEIFSYLLVATGRRPDFEGLELDKAGLALDAHGTPIFDPQTLQCGDSPIFLAGDANHDRPVLHEAAAEGRIAGANAASYPALDWAERALPLSIVFSDPQIAVVGTAKANHPGIVCHGVDFADQGRARIMGAPGGLLRVYVDRASGALLGGAMVCPAAEHLAHLLAWAAQTGLAAKDLLGLPVYHPTLEEGLRAALRVACARLHVAPALKQGELEYGPGT